MLSYYIQTNVMCMLLLAGVLMSVFGGRSAAQARKVAFRRLIHLSIIMCVADIFAWIFDGRNFPFARPILEVSNIVYTGCISWACYAWLNYVNVRILPLEYNRRRRTMLGAIPVLVLTVALVTNPLHHFFFSFSEQNVYSRGSGVIVHWVVSWGYLLTATFLTFREIHRARTRVEKRQLIPMLWFIVAPALAAVGQMIFYGTTIMQCGITLSIIMISVGVIREQISNDVLTGLNNRRALENFINDRLDRPGRKFSILMCDIDDFKNINDSYGHAVGDLALKNIAHALKLACGRSGSPVFLCRYGGDEFVICGVDLKAGELEDLVRILKQDVEGTMLHTSVDQKLSVSIGIATGVCYSDADVDRLILIADGNMYQDKNSRKS